MTLPSQGECCEDSGSAPIMRCGWIYTSVLMNICGWLLIMEISAAKSGQEVEFTICPSTPMKTMSSDVHRLKIVVGYLLSSNY